MSARAQHFLSSRWDGGVCSSFPGPATAGYRLLSKITLFALSSVFSKDERRAMGSTVTGKKTVGFTEECPNGAPGPQKRADRFRSIQNSAGSAFARCHAILHLKNVLKFSSSGLQFRDQQTKCVHNFLPLFAVTSCQLETLSDYLSCQTGR